MASIATVGGGYQLGDGNPSEVKTGVQATPIQLPIGAITLTAAQLTSGLLVTVAGTAARAQTLPTGVLMDALLTNVKRNMTFDIVMVNLGTTSGVVTVAAGVGFTIVGLATIPVSSSAVFRARRTQVDGVWVLYRITA